jgi:hypothetical protein
MSWLQKFPWLSLSLLLLTYGVFGWIVAQSLTLWSFALIEQGKTWGWFLEEDTASGIIYLLEIAAILLISLALTMPITLLTIFFGTWLKSDTSTMLSILGWSFLFVIVVRWISTFIRFLVLFAAAVLLRLDLQEAGYNKWQTFFVLIVACFFGFGSGIFTYHWLNS